jgi:hypothetical protein
VTQHNRRPATERFWPALALRLAALCDEVDATPSRGASEPARQLLWALRCLELHLSRVGVPLPAALAGDDGSTYGGGSEVTEVVDLTGEDDIDVEAWVLDCFMLSCTVKPEPQLELEGVKEEPESDVPPATSAAVAAAPAVKLTTCVGFAELFSLPDLSDVTVLRLELSPIGIGIGSGVEKWTEPAGNAKLVPVLEAVASAPWLETVQELKLLDIISSRTRTWQSVRRR